MNHGDWMGTGHWLFMVLWWGFILGGVFAVGFITGRASGRRGQQNRDTTS